MVLGSLGQEPARFFELALGGFFCFLGSVWDALYAPLLPRVDRERTLAGYDRNGLDVAYKATSGFRS
jgi:hypothetical protein